MERVTISMSDEFAGELSAFMEGHHYANRSEAIRDLARRGLQRSRADARIDGECLTVLSYVFRHHTRELSKRLSELHHAHHDLQVASMQVYLDHDDCLEVAVLRGQIAAVREFANAVIAERGVRYGEFSFVPVAADSHAHTHGGSGQPHVHIRPVG